MQQMKINSKEKANHHTCKTLLNCYVREYGGRDCLTVEDRYYQIDFPSSNTEVRGQLAYYSRIGEHEFLTYSVSGHTVDYMDVLLLITRELQTSEPSFSQKQKVRFMKKVSNSFHKLSLFIEQAEPFPVNDYISSEQSLIYGHPFHPFPKNREGLCEEDLYHYSPECRSAFQLGYIAVQKKFFLEEWVGDSDMCFTTEINRAAEEKLGELSEDYKLLPMHPWQYKHVQEIKEVQRYEDEGHLIFLGIFGPFAYPTSSVRTVYLPEWKCNLKLPLNLQITNLKRNNTTIQMRRTLEATRYLLDRQCFASEPSTAVSYETGTSSCFFNDERLTELFTFAYRPVDFDIDSTYVVSSLVETDPTSHLYRLQHLVPPHKLEAWFCRYLEISLLPIVREAEAKGIHFEAHLQNSLVTLNKEGMPKRFIVRDLEGVSVDKLKAGETDADPALFYSTEDAWQRTSYYFLVNHLGSLIHVIARIAGVPEEQVWKVVDGVLTREYESTGNAFIKYLLSTETFVAKKNMVSCFFGKGEAPKFVPVANLINERRRDWDARTKSGVGVNTFNHS